MTGEPSTQPFGSPKRICPRRPERSRNLRNLGETLVWNLEPSTEPFKTEPFDNPRQICRREPQTPRNLKNLGGTWSFRGTFWRPKTDLPQKTREITKLAQPWWNLGGTFRRTFWRPKTDLPQRTTESPKAILPRNLYYGWRPQSYCCWGKTWSAWNPWRSCKHNLLMGSRRPDLKAGGV